MSGQKMPKVDRLKVLEDFGILQTTRPSCWKLAARFCSAVKDGRAPETSDLKAVAYALQAVLEFADHPNSDISDTVGHRLGITTKQGQAWSVLTGDFWEDTSAVCDYLEEVRVLTEKGLSQKKAEMGARAAMMERMGIGDRACRNKIKKHEASAKAMIRAAEAIG